MSLCPPLAFESLNETDVREEIIAPLLKMLGYRSGTEFNVVREQLLRYPKTFLGHKNPVRDPDLRGKADYILEVKSLIRWVIEAKSPSVQIKAEDIQQAWSYANHPEIRAVYFALCNGRSFQVFQTQHGPAAGPILNIEYEAFDFSFGQIAALISPESLLRDFPAKYVDESPPLGPGLRSIVRITSGWIRNDYNSLNQKALNELQYAIPLGSVERNEDGGLLAFLKIQAPLRFAQELNEKLGLDLFEMSSAGTELSTDPQAPTLFSYQRSVVLPAGEKMLDLTTWQESVLPFNLQCDVVATAQGSLSGYVFSGRFTTRMSFPLAQLVAEVGGPFELNVA